MILFEGKKTFHFRKNEWPASDKKEYILFDNKTDPYNYDGRVL